MAKRRTKPPITPRQPGQTYRRDFTSETAMLIGNCIALWSYVEQAIEEMVWAFLRIGIEEGRIVTARLDARHKMMLLDQLGHRHLKKEDLPEFLSVLPRLEDLYEIRNMIAHGQWVTLIPDEIPAVMSLREKLPEETPRDEVITTAMPEENLQATLNNMYILQNYLIDLRKRISASQDK